MTTLPESIEYRDIGEWTLTSRRGYDEPFVDVAVDATFVAPSGVSYSLPGFYDGAPNGVQTWRLRFSPNEVGTWRYTITTGPADDELEQAGTFEVSESEREGFVKSTPGVSWGFETESGLPVFLMGDTVYNLFGAAHCGMDVSDFLARRAQQGFNIFRVRCQVSPFHPPDAYSVWQTRRTWPWGGSEQSPRFDRFNLDYFRTVDGVLWTAADLRVGFEMIMEAWGFEYPFNDRSVFLPEWEQLWMRYLVARYDAFSSVYIWTLMNEYEFYPDGDWRHNPLADRWAVRTARWLKGIAPHGHPVAVHNGPRMPPFAERFAADPDAIDAVMFQAWGSGGKDDGWLTAGIETTIEASFEGWEGSAVFSEWGYERNPELEQTFPGFTHTGPEHNRRGAWRGAFSGMGVINGFENTWGPVMNLHNDQTGVRYFELLHRFFTDVVPFHRLAPAADLLVDREYETGYRPLVLASEDLDIVAVYFPAGGTATLDLPTQNYLAQWFDPTTGDVQTARPKAENGRLAFTAPEASEPEAVSQGHPPDFVLTLSATTLS